MAEAKQPPRPVLFSGVRLIDPASGRDGDGDLLVLDGRIAAVEPGLADKGVRRISVGGALARAAWGGFMRAARMLAEEGRFEGFADAASGKELNALFRE